MDLEGRLVGKGLMEGHVNLVQEEVVNIAAELALPQYSNQS